MAGRERSRSPRQEIHQLQPGTKLPCCVLFGGPASGKTTLGRYLQSQLPGFVHVSSGDLARLVTPFEGSPFLSSIAQQLADRRRRKVAFARLTEVLHKVVAEAVNANPVWGIIIDGLRPAELPGFQRVVGCNLVAVIKLSCPASEMLVRLQQRDHREGDERLGLSEMDPLSRIKAFEERDGAEIDALQDVFRDAFLSLDTSTGSSTVEALAQQIVDFAEPLREARVSKALPAPTEICWGAVIGAVASKLDQQYHPDGKPR